jgi:hypothetical protein
MRHHAAAPVVGGFYRAVITTVAVVAFVRRFEIADFNAWILFMILPKLDDGFFFVLSVLHRVQVSFVT